ncbi:MAG: FKBP-type peptidyl-prolyl cis-trans isomerase N-terminal domain-containing protein, partial [Crocinitomicaceae bacterium]|nr:FKBP-type peptidyl-prolyl cis-trans isomerase N-terminal domain-containing protein [Crocinitomicaceae bacterium]
MKKNLLFLFLPAIVLFTAASCGDGEDESTVEIVEFETSKDKLSYALGVDNAKRVFSGDPKFEALDREMLKKGFNSSLSAEMDNECQLTLQQFLGPQGYDFDTTYLKSGSECIGKIMAGTFYAQISDAEALGNINLDMVRKGFEHGLNDTDTASLSVIDRTAVLDEFGKSLAAKGQAKQQAIDNSNIAGAEEFWKKVKAIPGVKQVGTSGVYYETIQQGSGGKPSETSDVEAHYILTYGAIGDTLESSYAAPGPIKINLGSVISGWRTGFTALKKGGKYRLFIPHAQAYLGMGGPQGPLVFY